MCVCCRYELYSDMVRNSTPREVTTYGSLLYACSRVGNFDKA